MATPKLTAAIITFNEEKNICRCLESVRWTDELIVVDSFSTDRTVELARQYTGNVLQRTWAGHVLQKQFALEQATGDWIISLDADEELSADAAAEIRSALADAPLNVNGYSFPRRSFYLGRWIRHGGWYPDRKLRLVRRGHARWGGQDPHDKLMADGQTRDLQGNILHYVYSDIAHQLRTVDSFSRITAELWLEKGKRAEPAAMLCKPVAKFFGAYVWKLGMLDGMPGLIISVISAYYVFLKYAKLWELQKGQKNTAV
ncbi:MAG: glycosyltransferase family 2 protein [Proteobacteria bacterium]|nr:glycosyltransferase family 2 protein [Pseudomonadota bacterium]